MNREIYQIEILLSSQTGQGNVSSAPRPDFRNSCFYVGGRIEIRNPGSIGTPVFHVVLVRAHALFIVRIWQDIDFYIPLTIPTIRESVLRSPEFSALFNEYRLLVIRSVPDQLLNYRVDIRGPAIAETFSDCLKESPEHVVSRVI